MVGNVVAWQLRMPEGFGLRVELGQHARVSGDADAGPALTQDLGVLAGYRAAWGRLALQVNGGVRAGLGADAADWPYRAIGAASPTPVTSPWRTSTCTTSASSCDSREIVNVSASRTVACQALTSTTA